MSTSKHSKISLERSLIIVSVVGFTFYLVSLIVIFFLGEPSLAKPAPQAVTHAGQKIVSGTSVGVGLPIRLKIPKIYVNAPVGQVGITSGGAMGVPAGPHLAAWFKLGPRPGDTGSAIIDGHFGWGDGIAAVFDDLHKLEKGDKIYIQNDQGMIIPFVVVNRKSYDPDASATDVFGSADGKAHLNLITCEGAWDKASKSYSKRLIVFADRETQ